MALAFLFALLVIATLLAFKRPFRALTVVFFLAPWQGLDVDVGLRVTGYLIFIAPLFAATVLFSIARSGAQTAFASIGYLWWILLYAIFWSLLQIPFFPDSLAAGGAPRSPEARALIQIPMFFLTISPLFIVPWLVQTPDKLQKLLRTYLKSVILLSSLGWIQIIVWAVTGSDPLPIGSVNGLITGEISERSGIFYFGDDLVYRMSSLGGEPKGLGAGLVVGLLLVQAGYNLSSRWRAFVWPFLFLSMAATFSTMALMAWFAASAVQLFFLKKKAAGLSSSHRRLAKRYIGLFGVLLVLIPGIFFAFSESRFVQILELRTTERIFAEPAGPGSSPGYLEDFNEAVFNFLVDSPLIALVGVGIGNAHLYADPFLPDYAVRYAGGTTFVAKSAMLRWISELGLLTMIIFLVWWLGLLRRVVRSFEIFPNQRFSAEFLKPFAISLLAFWLVSGYITPQFFLFTGMLLALYRTRQPTIYPRYAG